MKLANQIMIILFFACIGSCMNSHDDAAESEQKHALIDGVKKSISEQEVLIAQANKGNVQAASALGEHFLLVKNDYDAAKYWFRKAADNGGAKEKEIYHSFLESMKEFDEDQ